MAQLRTPGRSSVTSRSPIRIRPALALSSPAIIRRDVVLPQPEGPTSTTNSPSATSRSRAGITVTSPKRFSTRSSATRAMPPFPPVAAAL